MVKQKPQKLGEDGKPKKSFDEHEGDCYEELFGESLAAHTEKEAVKEEVRKLTEVRKEVRAEVETLTQEKTRLQRLVSRLSESLGRLFGKLQSIAMGRGTVLDYVKPEAQAVVDDLNELDNEEYEL